MIINPIPMNRIRAELDTTIRPELALVQRIAFFLEKCEAISQLLYPFSASFQILPRGITRSPEFYEDLFKECFSGEELVHDSNLFAGFFDAKNNHTCHLFGLPRRTYNQQRSPILRGMILQYSPLQELWNSFLGKVFTQEDTFDLVTAQGFRFRRTSRVVHPREAIEPLVGYFFIYCGWNKCSVNETPDKNTYSGKRVVVECNTRVVYPDFVQTYDRVISTGDIQL